MNKIFIFVLLFYEKEKWVGPGSLVTMTLFVAFLFYCLSFL